MTQDVFSAVFSSVRNAIPVVHKEGYPFIAAFTLITIIFAAFQLSYLFWPMFFLTLWCVAFFRDPPRVTPIGDTLVISPADGRVLTTDSVLPPADLQLGSETMIRVSIFMSVFDAHVNRAPVAGQITRISYRSGTFLNADLDKASEDNERNGVVIQSGERTIGVVQIAGLVARRIVSFVKEGDSLASGERFGLIRFGSRVDVYLPEGAPILVSPGQRTVAGETIIADFKAAKSKRQYRIG